MEISYQSDAQNGRQGSKLSELAGWRSWGRLVICHLGQGRNGTKSMVKRQFQHRELRKRNLADNKWIGGRREHQSVTTDTYYLPWEYSWRGGGDGGWEFAERRADGPGSERAMPTSHQQDDLKRNFRLCLHIHLSQSCDKIRINLLCKWCFVVIYLFASTAQLTWLHKQCAVASNEAEKYVPKQEVNDIFKATTSFLLSFNLEQISCHYHCYYYFMLYAVIIFSWLWIIELVTEWQVALSPQKVTI